MSLSERFCTCYSHPVFWVKVLLKCSFTRLVQPWRWTASCPSTKILGMNTAITFELLPVITFLACWLVSTMSNVSFQHEDLGDEHGGHL